MTKKRFYKLLRAFLVELGMMDKESDMVCKRMRGIHRTKFSELGYQWVWDHTNDKDGAHHG